MNKKYHQQVRLLLEVLPFAMKENCFALKGGTALNLLMWDFPRKARSDLKIKFQGKKLIINAERQNEKEFLISFK